jgi:hypothetical protein
VEEEELPIVPEPPVELTVSHLRHALWAEMGGGDHVAAGPTALAGRLFHQTLAGLLRGPRNWSTVLRGSDLKDPALLSHHAYEQLLGPLLAQNEAQLAQSGREALWLWQAVREACTWLCGVLQAALDQGWIRWDGETGAWSGHEHLLVSEQPVSRLFSNPAWRAPIRISGTIDAVLRDPSQRRWCTLEFKLSGSARPVDLCQAALYQLLLTGDAQPAEDNAVALLHFTPERKELVLSEAELADARERLLELAARLAGVLPADAQDHGGAPAPEPMQYAALGRNIERILTGLGQPVTLAGEPVVGPAFVRYRLHPGQKVRVKALAGYSQDLGVRLSMPEPMIQVEDGTLAVDVARPDPQVVSFTRVRHGLAPLDRLQGCAQVPLGVDLSNRLRALDLAASESPHVLVAGTAGSGKSEWLRMAVASLLLSNTPETLRLVLIDPKRNAFSEMAASPFLLNREALVHPPEHSAMDHLDIVIAEMEHRYDLFHHTGTDTLRQYREATRKPLPRIVCVIDEFADLMLAATDRKQLESRVVRLGAKARAAGIHLILATQHPDAKTVTGPLQANLSVRICFKTTTYQQSMVALKQSGAERLLGAGDLLYSSGARLLRLQAPLLPENERRRIFSAS